jgi:DNA primase
VDEIISYYRQELKKSQLAIDYLKSRGITAQTTNEFKIGYAPSFPRYDYIFRERIMIPVRNNDGEYIAFVGRTIVDSSPKYLNTWETIEYQKSRILFGYFDALPYIKKEFSAILVEGQFDFLTLWQNGVRNIVASSGNFTTAQARLLSRYTDKVYIILDNDTAGNTSATKAKRYLEDLNVKPVVIKLPDCKDPDEYIRAKGIDKFKELIK